MRRCALSSTGPASRTRGCRLPTGRIPCSTCTLDPVPVGCVRSADMQSRQAASARICGTDAPRAATLMLRTYQETGTCRRWRPCPSSGMRLPGTAPHRLPPRHRPWEARAPAPLGRMPALQFCRAPRGVSGRPPCRTSCQDSTRGICSNRSTQGCSESRPRGRCPLQIKISFAPPAAAHSRATCRARTATLVVAVHRGGAPCPGTPSGRFRIRACAPGYGSRFNGIRIRCTARRGSWRMRRPSPLCCGLQSRE